MKQRSSMRRIFLKRSAFAACALALPGFRLLAQSRKDRLGVALVGLGYYSTDLLAPALTRTRHCHLAGIVTGTPAKAEEWAKRYGLPDRNVYDYANFDRIADNPDIDVIYVVLPPSMHADFSIRAAKAGKHVWCEKPMAMTVQECHAMVRACRDNRVVLAIGYRMQHEPNTQAVIRFGRESTYGRVKSVTAAAGYYDVRTTRHWRQQRAMGGGAMYDMGVYPLQAARYCSGEEPVAVTATQATARPELYRDVGETMMFDLEFPGGAMARCKTSFGLSMNSLRANCEKGWYQLEPFQTYSGIQGVTSDGRRLDAVIENQQAKQMDDDALAIIEGRPPLVPGEEGLRDIRVVEAVYASARTGRRVAL